MFHPSCSPQLFLSTFSFCLRFFTSDSNKDVDIISCVPHILTFLGYSLGCTLPLGRFETTLPCNENLKWGGCVDTTFNCFALNIVLLHEVSWAPASLLCPEHWVFHIAARPCKSTAWIGFLTYRAAIFSRAALRLCIFFYQTLGERVYLSKPAL